MSLSSSLCGMSTPFYSGMHRQDEDSPWLPHCAYETMDKLPVLAIPDYLKKDVANLRKIPIHGLWAVFFLMGHMSCIVKYMLLLNAKSRTQARLGWGLPLLAPSYIW